MSDPRLDGQIVNYWDSDEYFVDSSSVGQVGTGTWRITNDEGAWQGSFRTVYLDDEWVSTVYPLYGSGAYEGLVALHEHRHVSDADDYCFEVRGLIIDGELPDIPGPAAD